jgi:DNA-binding transcriptional regulator YdaS (Cro superfamily)
MNQADVIKRLADECRAVGGQSAWARQAGVSATYVSDVLAGKREPGGRLLLALGIKRVVLYMEVEENGCG